MCGAAVIVKSQLFLCGAQLIRRANQNVRSVIDSSDTVTTVCPAGEGAGGEAAGPDPGGGPAAL